VANKLYVGNLPFDVTESDLQNLFAPHGIVQSTQVMLENTGRSKGFGFVEMDTSEEAQAAITALNGQERDGRAVTVEHARPPGRPGQELSVRDRWALMSERPVLSTDQALQVLLVRPGE
jgi:RNA recognition motif-containing protein